jgi:nucleoside-diphosphate-sugar epimerase
MDILVGYTGFVGSNLALRHKFEGFNSKNIKRAFGTNPDLCVYAGVRAEKFLANADPDADLESMREAVLNIKKINPKRLVLISTIDVFSDPVGAYENSPVKANENPYGRNRYFLEQEAALTVPDCYIIRLPGLFGKNLKKNFIFDLINVAPFMLNKSKFSELSKQDPRLLKYYVSSGDGFYKLTAKAEDKPKVIDIVSGLNFTALNFTDSRAVFQFYNLKYLWEHIKIALQNNIKILHLATEPIGAAEIYRRVKGAAFENKLEREVPYYDFKTNYADLFGGKNGYIFGKQKILEEIAEFIDFT